MKSSLTLALVLVCLPLTQVHATDIPDLNLCTATIPDGSDGAVVFVVPDGSGLSFAEAFAPGGSSVDATITLTLVNWAGDPIVDYPPEDIWLETSEDGLAGCAGGTSPDFVTDINGQTYWIDPLEAGGCSTGEELMVYVAGAPLYASPLDLVFRSPDLSGDLLVDLTDIVLFTQSLDDGEGSCADFNNDSHVNLSDVVRMTGGIGDHCN